MLRSVVCDDVDDDPLAIEGAEPLELGGDLVGADRQRRQAIDAFAVGHLGADEAGLRVRGR